MIYHEWLPTAALLIDTLIGDPRSSWHPVVLIGNLISLLQHFLLKKEQSALAKKIAGMLLVIITLGITYGTIWVIMYGCRLLNSYLEFVVGAVLMSFTISPRSLKEAGMDILGYLKSGDMDNARIKVGWIVGRDTQKLDSSEVTRATVETVAENIVDGIISPLFYLAIGGVPLAFLYRAVNTLDSMVGYKNEKYIDFGMVAARVDDVFNYIPARITALLLVTSSFLLGYSAKKSIKCILRDAKKHPSPNSGFAEAGVAGALGIRLGGLNYYFGVPHQRAYMGEAVYLTESKHIEQTINLMYVVTIIFIAVLTLIEWRY